MNQQCVIVEDVRGPYDTQLQCKARAEEMKKDVESEFPFMKAVNFHCNKTKGQAT
tara:strand:- start:198 stop:362 length:165 start_codon:yes stop_codon:yes gene_type:complete